MILHQKLGATELQSAYHTLVEAHEFDSLGPIVSGMLHEGQRNAASGAAAGAPATSGRVYQTRQRLYSATSGTRAPGDEGETKISK